MTDLITFNVRSVYSNATIVKGIPEIETTVAVLPGAGNITSVYGEILGKTAGNIFSITGSDLLLRSLPAIGLANTVSTASNNSNIEGSSVSLLDFSVPVGTTDAGFKPPTPFFVARVTLPDFSAQQFAARTTQNSGSSEFIGNAPTANLSQSSQVSNTSAIASNQVATATTNTAVPFNVRSISGNATTAPVTLTAKVLNGTSGVEVTITLPSGAGDLTSVYGEILGNTVNSISSITGSDILSGYSATIGPADQVSTASNQSNIQDSKIPPFDFSVPVGTTGTGFKPSTTFFIAGVTLPDFSAQRFGARTTQNSGSGKLVGNAPLIGRVFQDLNVNGLQDAGETGLSTVTVNLYQSSQVNNGTITGNPVATATTDANGYYWIPITNSGSYVIKFNSPSNYLFSSQNQGSNDKVDSDANTTTGLTAAFTYTAGAQNSLGGVTGSIDAGLYQKATIGDRVFLDSNANGLQDAGETGLSGITVQLLDSNSTVVATTTTDTSGLYNFNVNPGSYKIKVITPTNSNPYLFSPQDQGGNDSTDSDVNASGLSTAFTLTSGQTNNTIDAGLYQKATIGDRVFLDSNANGLQDAGEAGLAEVTVQLLDSSGNPVLNNGTLITATTDANGLYNFNVNPGSYRVKFSAPNGYSFSPVGNDLSAGNDSNADPSTGITAAFTVTSGQANNTIDAGLQNVDLKVDTTFNLEQFLLDRDGVDTNGDGNLELQNTYIASPIADQLPNPNNPNILQTVTQYINVTNLGLTVANNNVVTVDNIQSSLFSFAGASVPYTLSNNGNTIQLSVPSIASNGGTYQIALTWNIVNSDNLELTPLNIQYIFGSDSPTTYQPSGDYSNVVASGKLYIDRGSAVKDIGTSAVKFNPFPEFKNSVTVTAPNDSNTTNNSASESVYLLRSQLDATLQNGATSKLRSIYNQIVDVDPTVYSDPPEPGITTPGIGNKVWEDKNKNGLQDSGEYGIAGVVVNLFNASTNARVKQVKTQTGGYYSFGGLAAGSYYIQVQKPNNYGFFSSRDLGGDDTKDSDVDPATGKSVTFSVTSTTNSKNWDVGLYNSTSTTTSGAAPTGATYAVINDSDAIQAGEVGVARINPYWNSTKVDQTKLQTFENTSSQTQNPADANDFFNLFKSFIADGVFGIDTSSLTDPKTGSSATLQLESYNATTGSPTGRDPNNNSVLAGNINSNVISVTFSGSTSFQSFIDSLTQNYANTSFSISLSPSLIINSSIQPSIQLELATLTYFFSKKNLIAEILVPNYITIVDGQIKTIVPNLAFFTQQQAADLDASSLGFKSYNPPPTTATTATATANSADPSSSPTLYTGTIQFSGINNNNLKDSITGTAFNDVILGQAGADILNGFSGNDTILGGNGPDTINGGAGNDILRGEGGPDIFVFDKSFGNDTIGGKDQADAKIVDFSNNDIINLAALGITYQQVQNSFSVINGDGTISLNDGTITLTGITSLPNSSAFIF
jgi:hypothetical protein